LEFDKRSQFFSCSRKNMLSILAVYVSDPDRSPLKIDAEAWPKPSIRL
jgi:hypothetical protein